MLGIRVFDHLVVGTEGVREPQSVQPPLECCTGMIPTTFYYD